MKINIRKKWESLSLQAKASSAYTFANLLTKGIVFLSIPLFTRLMPTSEIGIATTFTSWQAMAFPVLTLAVSSGSLNIAMLQFQDERDRYQSSVLCISSLSSLVGMLIYWIFSKQIIAISSLSNELWWVILFSGLITPALEIYLARERYEYHYIVPTVMSIISSGGSVIFAILVVLAAKRSGQTNLGTIRVVSQYLFLFFVCGIIYIRIFIKGRTFYNKGYWRFALSTSIPLIFHTLSKQVMDVSDRTMIASMVGNSEAGIYGTIYSISNITLIVWTAINNALIPYIFESIKAKNYSGINRIIKPVLILFSVFTLLMTLFAPDIIRILLPADYYEAVYIIPAVSGGIYLTTLYNLFSNILLYYKKTNYIMAATSVAAITNIILNYICIKQFGYMAAAYTTLASYIILAFMQYKMMKKFTGNEDIYDTRFMIILSLFTISATLLCLMIYKNNVVRISIICGIVIVLVIFRKKVRSAMKLILRKS